jgi:PadR family transcriptional regulator, regulatory protein PadR
MPITRDKTTAPRNLFRGPLEMMISQSLPRQPMHGYGLVQHIKERSNHPPQVEEGSLYPTLQRMLKEKLVRAEWERSPTNRKVRTYRITTSGIRHLERLEQMLKGIYLVLSPAES